MVELTEAASIFNDDPQDQILDISEAFRPFFSRLVI